MNALLALAAPLAFLLPGAVVVVDSSAEVGEAFEDTAAAFRAKVQHQVRIEQQMTVRIAPRSAAPPPPMMMQPPRRGLPRVHERKVGNCLAVGNVRGVQAGGESKLLLFMRDQRIISAELEKTCQARDFYSGFYVPRSADGQVCVNREKLQSRSGAKCALTKIRQVIIDDD